MGWIIDLCPGSNLQFHFSFLFRSDSIESEISLVEEKVEEILEEEDVEVDPFYVLLPDYEDARQQTFVEVALTASKGEKYIVLVVADEGYLHLYQNFYEASVIPLSLPTLSIALDEPSLQYPLLNK